MRREFIIWAIAVGLTLGAALLLLAAFQNAARDPAGGWVDYGFPVLAGMMGFGFAQASAGGWRAAAYHARDLYDWVAEQARVRLEEGLSDDWLAPVRTFSAFRHGALTRQLISAQARRELVEAYEDLRRLIYSPDSPLASDRAARRRVEFEAGHFLQSVHVRRLKAEVEAEGAGLRPGVEYTLRLRLAADGPGRPTAALLAPDFGGLSKRELLVELLPEDLEVGERCLHLELPQFGDSTVAQTRIKLGPPGKPRLKIVIASLPELTVLQTYEIKLPVALPRVG
jgi:hypothetical protein